MSRERSRAQLLDSREGEKLTLGQTVYIKRRLCKSKSQTQGFVGVVTEVIKKGPQSSVRLRSVIMGTGVELLVPIFSPLVECIKILKKPESVPVGPNLFGLRDNMTEMSRFMDESWLTEKGRVSLLKRLNRESNM